MSKNQALKQIKSYLDNMAKEDELFAKMYQKEEKTIDKCFAYIVGVARKRGNAVCMTDEEVYSLAVHYYCEDDLKVEQLPRDFKVAKTSENVAVELSDADKERLKAEVEAEYKKKMLKELEEKKNETPKKKKVNVTSRDKTKTEKMGCLFDF